MKLLDGIEHWDFYGTEVVMDANLIETLAKQAAATYRKPVLLPPKRVTSTSRTVKLRGKQSKEESDREAERSVGNVQPPYRYGRKVK